LTSTQEPIRGLVEKKLTINPPKMRNVVKNTIDF
jgi:hypothetical protein